MVKKKKNQIKSDTWCSYPGLWLSASHNKQPGPTAEPVRPINTALVANCEKSFAANSHVKMNNLNSDPTAYCFSLKTLKQLLLCFGLK